MPCAQVCLDALAKDHLLKLRQQLRILTGTPGNVLKQMVLRCALAVAHVLNFFGKSASRQFFFENHALPGSADRKRGSSGKLEDWRARGTAVEDGFCNYKSFSEKRWVRLAALYECADVTERIGHLKR